MPRRAQKVTWTQVETGSAITWKYPSCVLRRRQRRRVPFGRAHHHRQQADTGTKMIHVGKRTTSRRSCRRASAPAAARILSRAGEGGTRSAEGAQPPQCDSLLIGDKQCGAHTFPTSRSSAPTRRGEHEATTSKISDDQLFYCRSRGNQRGRRGRLIVDGFCKQVFRELPMEFAVEAKKLLEVSLEGAVG